MKIIISYLVIFLIIIFIAFYYFKLEEGFKGNQIVIPVLTNNQSPVADISQSISAGKELFNIPLSQAKQRITKKPFGIYITPQNSPIQPEKFSGYHTGTDFEILPGEENIDVPVYAICDGKIIYKKAVSGYGGVIIQSCKIENQPVTVLYGHLSLAKSPAEINDEIKKGDQIAILGQGKSAETDGERKHLHLGIHKGTVLELRGYVQNQGELTSWLDFQKIFGL